MPPNQDFAPSSNKDPLIPFAKGLLVFWRPGCSLVFHPEVLWLVVAADKHPFYRRIVVWAGPPPGHSAAPPPGPHVAHKGNLVIADNPLQVMAISSRRPEEWQ